MKTLEQLVLDEISYVDGNEYKITAGKLAALLVKMGAKVEHIVELPAKTMQ